MEHLIFLHGALGTAHQLEPIANALKGEHQNHILTFSGHGGSEIPSKMIISNFAEEVINYMDKNNIQSASFFGYSMGGYVAMYLAINFPQKINALATLATKWQWNPEIAKKETAMLNPEILKEKVPAYAQSLILLHSEERWKSLLSATSTLLTDMGNAPPVKNEDLEKVTIPVMFCLGDSDRMVSLDETKETQGLLKNCQLSIISSTKHPVETCNIIDLTKFLCTFFGIIL
ncbi:MAG: alpha/beta fold hydrolase [Bacteroidia bacterium]|nr:alpha/beta fold hydrolase [Bacteroidia bacterium]